MGRRFAMLPDHLPGESALAAALDLAFAWASAPPLGGAGKGWPSGPTGRGTPTVPISVGRHPARAMDIASPAPQHQPRNRFARLCISVPHRGFVVAPAVLVRLAGRSSDPPPVHFPATT